MKIFLIAVGKAEREQEGILSTQMFNLIYSSFLCSKDST